jgi:hypothetical protein
LPPERRTRGWRAGLFFLVVWAFRWLSIGAVENDHFVALARAHQLLYGDWPVRDFADPGQPRRNHAVTARRVTNLPARGARVRQQCNP